MHFYAERTTAPVLRKADWAADSRIWAGIHYEMDLRAGAELGTKVAQKVIDWASKDGSQ